MKAFSLVWMRQLPNAHLMKYEDAKLALTFAMSCDNHIEVVRSPTVWEQTVGIILQRWPYIWLIYNNSNARMHIMHIIFTNHNELHGYIYDGTRQTSLIHSLLLLNIKYTNIKFISFMLITC
jgi:hypothetical protein